MRDFNRVKVQKTWKGKSAWYLVDRATGTPSKAGIPEVFTADGDILIRTDDGNVVVQFANGDDPICLKASAKAIRRLKALEAISAMKVSK